MQNQGQEKVCRKEPKGSQNGYRNQSKIAKRGQRGAKGSPKRRKRPEKRHAKNEAEKGCAGIGTFIQGASAHTAGPVYGFVSLWCVGLISFFVLRPNSLWKTRLRRSIPNSIYFLQNSTRSVQKAPKMEPKGPNMDPKRAQMEPKGPNIDQKGAES